MIGGQVGFAGHIVIGDNVRIQAQSGVGKNVKDGDTLQGSPSFNYGDWNKSYVHFIIITKYYLPNKTLIFNAYLLNCLLEYFII